MRCERGNASPATGHPNGRAPCTGLDYDRVDAVPFFNLYDHGFVRVALAMPEVRVADPDWNAARTLELLREAAEARALLAVFPELGLTAYSCEDLFHQQALLDAAREALGRVVEASRELQIAAVVGLPLALDGRLYNCAAVFARGRLLGVSPKSFLPNHQEFYELRQFTPGAISRRTHVDLCGESQVPFGTRLLFDVEGVSRLRFFVEICEDLWTPVPPSSFAALAGATVLVNLSASNVTIGKDEYRRQLVAGQSGRCIAGYVYAAAGYGESTTDLAWDGHGMIYENGTKVAESERFVYGPQLVVGEIDLDRIEADRMRNTSFAQAASLHASECEGFRRIAVAIEPPADERLPLVRRYERFPYVPADPATRDSRCREVSEIQVQGLVKRLRAMRSEKVVIGVSGGLDSTQALLVCARAMDAMELPRANVLAYTLPGFATSERTLGQSRRLMEAVGATAGEIDIRPSCMQMLRDIGHPFANGEPVHDVTFENVQAGERASHLFRLANMQGAPVVGTSDLSELALGWCTYGVGDHMAHYHVNASVPKSLLRFLVGHAARTDAFGRDVSRVLDDVLATEVSPELVPGSDASTPGQSTEAVVGPYELQDFHLYYLLRFGHRPRKVAFLAWNAWRDRKTGDWPGVADDDRHEYAIGEIRRWLGVFLRRFFELSQYKRSALPNAPKVGSGGSLSPRGDWRAPSDAEAAAFLADLERVPDREP